MEETSSRATSGLRGPLVWLAALSLSIGWGIRGNYGHEWGAMIPGALAAMAVVILSGREDWYRRIAYFAFFGAIGWGFGGSISYMQVIGYTHSGHSLSVFYGFVCLFIIGFLWGAMGGAGTAAPAFLSRERLTEFFGPLIAIYAALMAHEWTYEPMNAWLAQALGKTRMALNADFRHEDPLYWFDTDWTSVLVAMGAVLLLALIRRRLDHASRFILTLCVGWWISFLLLVNVLGLRMTPPRGDSWAGNVGMVAALFFYLYRHRMSGIGFAALVSGLIGGVGFAGSALVKLILIRFVALGLGWETNWHSVLEQTYGFINGIGVAVAMGLLMRYAPPVNDAPPARRWTEPLAVGFTLLLLTYNNVHKNVEDWVEAKAMPETMYFLSAEGWFNIGYLALAVALFWLMAEHRRRPFPLIPPQWQGKAQMLYLAFLWWMVVANLMKAIGGFAPQRLITEGVILINAVLCSLMALMCARKEATLPIQPITQFAPWIRRAALVGLAGMGLFVVTCWGIIRALYSDRHAGDRYARLHIRFGPNATTRPKPKPGQPHP